VNLSKKDNQMIVVQVTLKVKPDRINDFIEYTRENVRNSVKETGVRRFEFYRKKESNNVFVLFEIYNSTDDQMKHRETSHFKNWKANVMSVLEEPYVVKQYEAVAADIK
jgi:(4S)-4-hydroxy-5-phosphonooxypentane-2,3-dione isomerase